MAAHAQSALDAQCPNAAATLDSIAFPLDLPAATKTGEAVVEFTIGADGSIGEATAACANFPAVLQGLDVRGTSCEAVSGAAIWSWSSCSSPRVERPISSCFGQAVASSRPKRFAPSKISGACHPRSLGGSGFR
jgi:hypothetical protein